MASFIPSSPRADLVARYPFPVRAKHLLSRWYNGSGSVPSVPVHALSIPGDSAVVTKVRPTTVSDRQVVAALAVVCSVTFLCLVGYLGRKIWRRRQRVREEAEADIAFQALEKGMGGGSSPPMEHYAPSLWGKGLGYFQSEKKRGSWSSHSSSKEDLDAPRPAMLRERTGSSDSVGSGKSYESSNGSSSGQTSPVAVMGEFGVVTRLPRNPTFERKKSKLRLVRGDLDHVPEEEDEQFPDSPSSGSSTTFPASSGSSLYPTTSTPASPHPTTLPLAPSPAPSSPPTPKSPTESLPTNLRPLELNHSWSDASLGASFITASPSGSSSPLHPTPEEDELALRDVGPTDSARVQVKEEMVDRE